MLFPCTFSFFGLHLWCVDFSLFLWWSSFFWLVLFVSLCFFIIVVLFPSPRKEKKKKEKETRWSFIYSFFGFQIVCGLFAFPLMIVILLTHTFRFTLFLYNCCVVSCPKEGKKKKKKKKEGDKMIFYLFLFRVSNQSMLITLTTIRPIFNISTKIIVSILIWLSFELWLIHNLHNSYWALTGATEAWPLWYHFGIGR